MGLMNGSNNDEYVKLLGAWPSPFVLRTRIALNLKKVAYEYLEEEDTLNSESVLNYNPVHKHIPILIHGNKPIRESLNIVMYVDETWLSGPPILPSDPFDRAIARFWDVYIDEHCFTSINGVAVAKDEEERKAAIAKLEQCMALLEETFQECSKGRGFFGGDNIGFIDIGFGSMLGPLKVLEKFTGVKFIHPENQVFSIGQTDSTPMTQSSLSCRISKNWSSLLSSSSILQSLNKNRVLIIIILKKNIRRTNYHNQDRGNKM